MLSGTLPATLHFKLFDHFLGLRYLDWSNTEHLVIHVALDLLSKVISSRPGGLVFAGVDLVDVLLTTLGQLSESARKK